MLEVKLDEKELAAPAAGAPPGRARASGRRAGEVRQAGGPGASRRRHAFRGGRLAGRDEGSRRGRALLPLALGRLRSRHRRLPGRRQPRRRREEGRSAARAAARHRDPAFARDLSLLLGPPLVDGNAAEVLVNGDRIFKAMLEDIRSAKSTISFETYIYWDGHDRRRVRRARSPTARGTASRCTSCSTGSAAPGSTRPRSSG